MTRNDLVKFIGWIFRAFFWALVIATPLMGVWLASSLATFLDGPTWLAIAAGAALFPGLPLLWEWVGHRGFAKKTARREAADKTVPSRWLTTYDRLILRTLVINTFFLGVLLGLFPSKSFTAVSARGDWFLDTAAPGPLVDGLRSGVFRAAEGLEWSYAAVTDNPYDTEPAPVKVEQGESADVVPLDDAQLAEEDTLAEGDDVGVGAQVADLIEGKVPTVPDVPDPKNEDSPKPDPSHEFGSITIERGGTTMVLDSVPEPKPVPPVPRPVGERPKGKWPMRTKLHPLVRSIPASSEVSIRSVGEYLAQEKDPTQRVKAIHDYVADRIAYDLRTKTYDEQMPKSVFARKTAVCAGYAKLAAALGEVTGDEILYVAGQARTDKVGGESHAWNAVKIEGRWYLMDITWDAGQGDAVAKPFQKRYRTDYLFTPPKIFAESHFATRADLQLLKTPMTKAEWMRMPKLRPGFHKQGLVLVSPLRPQVNAGRVGKIKLKNPRGRTVVAKAVALKTGKETRCKVSKSGEDISCDLSPGRQRVVIFSGPKSAKKFWEVGEVEMIRN